MEWIILNRKEMKHFETKESTDMAIHSTGIDTPRAMLQIRKNGVEIWMVSIELM
jgi:hypothetical protein